MSKHQDQPLPVDPEAARELVKRSKSAWLPTDYDHSLSLHGVGYSHDGRFLAASLGQIHRPSVTAVWNCTNWELLGVHEGLFGGFLEGTDLLRLDTIISGGAVRFKSRQVYVSALLNRPIKRLAGYPSTRPPSEVLRTFTSTGRVKFWNESFRGREIRLEGAKHLHRAILSPNGRLLATSSYATVSLWTTESGEKLRTLEALSRGTDIFIGFLSDDRLWAFDSSEQHVLLWDLESGEQAGQIEVPGTDTLDRCAASPTGRYLATCPSMLGAPGFICDLQREGIVGSYSLTPLSFGGVAFADDRFLFVADQKQCLRLTTCDGLTKSVPLAGEVSRSAPARTALQSAERDRFGSSTPSRFDSSAPSRSRSPEGPRALRVSKCGQGSGCLPITTPYGRLKKSRPSTSASTSA